MRGEPIEEFLSASDGGFIDPVGSLRYLLEKRPDRWLLFLSRQSQVANQLPEQLARLMSFNVVEVCGDCRITKRVTDPPERVKVERRPRTGTNDRGPGVSPDTSRDQRVGGDRRPWRTWCRSERLPC